MPTMDEMERVKPVLREKIFSGNWGDSEQELVAILCSVTDIKMSDGYRELLS